jgi:hypothetical protein
LGGRGLRDIMELCELSLSDMRGIKSLKAEIKGTWSMSAIGEKYRLGTWKRGNHL